MSTVKLINGEAKIMAAVKAMVALGNKHADQIHTVLCSVFAHVREHKNTTLVDHVMGKLHQILNVKGIDVWIREFSNLRFIKEKGGYRKPEKKPLAINLDAMMATPYWELKVNRDSNRVVQFDIEGRIVSFISTALRNIAEHKTKQAEPRALAFVTKLTEFCKHEKVPLDNLEIPEGMKAPKVIAKSVDEAQAKTEAEKAKAAKVAAKSANGKAKGRKPRAPASTPEPQQAAA